MVRGPVNSRWQTGSVEFIKLCQWTTDCLYHRKSGYNLCWAKSILVDNLEDFIHTMHFLLNSLQENRNFVFDIRNMCVCVCIETISLYHIWFIFYKYILLKWKCEPSVMKTMSLETPWIMGSLPGLIHGIPIKNDCVGLLFSEWTRPNSVDRTLGQLKDCYTCLLTIWVTRDDLFYYVRTK